MGQAVSDLSEEDVTRLDLSEMLASWMRSHSEFEGKREVLDSYFFVMIFQPQRQFAWRPRVMVITSHQIALLKVSRDISLDKSIKYPQIDDVFFAPSYHLVKLKFKSGGMLYVNTAREEIPEEMVKIISNNLEHFRQTLSEAVSEKKELKGAAASLITGCETEQVGDPTFQARMDALAPVWSQLAGIGIQEEDLWDGNVDLLAVMDALNADSADLISQEEQRSGYLVYFNFPPEVFSGLLRKVYRVHNNVRIGQIILLLCGKLNISRDPANFCLTSAKGLLLDNDLTLADYGLGTLFLTWQLCLSPIDNIPKMGEVCLVDVSLPQEKFNMLDRKVILVPNSMTLKDVVQTVFEKIGVQWKGESLETMDGLPLPANGTLLLHGAGSLHKDKIDFKLRCDGLSDPTPISSPEAERGKAVDEDDTESKVPAAAITNNVVEAKTKSDSEIESERNTTTSGKESETETETETETDTDSEVKGANKDDKMIRTTRKSPGGNPLLAERRGLVSSHRHADQNRPQSSKEASTTQEVELERARSISLSETPLPTSKLLAEEKGERRKSLRGLGSWKQSFFQQLQRDAEEEPQHVRQSRLIDVGERRSGKERNEQKETHIEEEEFREDSETPSNAARALMEQKPQDAPLSGPVEVIQEFDEEVLMDDSGSESEEEEDMDRKKEKTEQEKHETSQKEKEDDQSSEELQKAAKKTEPTAIVEKEEICENTLNSGVEPTETNEGENKGEKKKLTVTSPKKQTQTSSPVSSPRPKRPRESSTEKEERKMLLVQLASLPLAQLRDVFSSTFPDTPIPSPVPKPSPRSNEPDQEKRSKKAEVAAHATARTDNSLLSEVGDGSGKTEKQLLRTRSNTVQMAEIRSIVLRGDDIEVISMATLKQRTTTDPDTPLVLSPEGKKALANATSLKPKRITVAGLRPIDRQSLKNYMDRSMSRMQGVNMDNVEMLSL